MAINQYPWLESTAKALLDMDKKLPNAILLYGPKGIGLYDLAKKFVAGLLCENVAWNGTACGKCNSCACFKAYTHPNYREILPQTLCELYSVPYELAANEKDKKTKSQDIRIHQIRALDSFVTLRVGEKEKRIVLIYPAERLRDEAASALLKTLEEPPQGLTFMLVSEDVDSVLPTIKSRSRLVRAPMPKRDEAIRFLSEAGVENPDIALNQAGGAPLFALGKDELSTIDAELKTKLISLLMKGNLITPFEIIDSYPTKTRVDVEEFTNFLLRWTYDLVRVKLELPMRYFDSKYRDEMSRLVIKATMKSLNTWTRVLFDSKRLATHPLDNKEVWEYLLVEYATVFMRR